MTQRLTLFQWESNTITVMMKMWKEENHLFENIEVNVGALIAGHKESDTLRYYKKRKYIVETEKGLFLKLAKLKYYAVKEGFNYYNNKDEIEKNIQILNARSNRNFSPLQTIISPQQEPNIVVNDTNDATTYVDEDIITLFDNKLKMMEDKFNTKLKRMRKNSNKKIVTLEAQLKKLQDELNKGRVTININPSV